MRDVTSAVDETIPFSVRVHEAALLVVRKASAYRMIETGELHRALGLGAPLPTETEAARIALDAALRAYEAAKDA